MYKKLPAPLRDLLDIYFEKRVSKASAALSYCLTLAIFPFLICLNAMIARLNIDSGDIFTLGENVIPSDTVQIINDYLNYLTKNDSKIMFFTGLILMATSASAAFRTLMTTMADIQGKARYQGIFGTVFSIALALAFLLVIYLSCIIIVSGEWLMNFIKINFGIALFSNNWHWIRFLFLFLMLYIIIYCIYEMTAPKEKKHIPRSTGAIIAAALLVVVSIVFSYMIGMSAKYTLVYGSLASIIILMVWFYTCGNILIMGNVLNLIIQKYSK